MFLRFIAVPALVCGLAVATRAQPSSTQVALNSDIRFFTLAASFDVARLGSASKFGTNLDPDLVRRLQQFYVAHKAGLPDEALLGQYFGLAIALTDPPELKPKSREEQLPDETRALLSFSELMREFYTQGHVSQRWVEQQPACEAELKRLQPWISEVFLKTDAYLRNAVSGSSRQQLHINSELAALPGSVNMRVMKNDYYLLLGPGLGLGTPGAASPGMDAVRHSYLHFHLDDLVTRGLSRVESKEKMLALVAKEQGVDPVYTRDFSLMAVESLIRAVELRMDRTTAVRAKDVIANAYRSGLLLTPYFYDALPAFQASETTFSDAFARIAAGISFNVERDRFQATFQNIPVPQRSTAVPEVLPAPVPAPVDPVRELIIEAQTAYNSMDNDGSRGLFEKVLREHDPNNGAALYGLGLLASRAADVEQSKLYFERTVKSSSADPSMKVWSYIYLGHIADLQCERDRATEYYRQAVSTGDNSREAQASAKSGLSKAFGDQCR